MRWQYCYVSHRGNDGGFITTYTENGAAMTTIESEADTSAVEARASLIWQLGQEGWELVTVLRVEDDALPPGATWYFKRPIDSGDNRGVRAIAARRGGRHHADRVTDARRG